MDYESVHSHRSGRSKGGRYRSVAPYSQVDETLFGDGKGGKAVRSAGGGSGHAVVSRGDVLRATGKTLAGQATFVRRSEVERMAAASVIKSNEDLEREAAALQKTKDAKRRVANERKKRMLALEEERKKRVPKSTLQLEDEAKNDGIRKNAAHIQEELLDEVKTLNTFARYAQTVTIRNMQLKEKEDKKAKEVEEEKLIALEMEIKRLEAVKMYHDREVKQRQSMVEARKQIEVQIEAREKEREKQRQALIREQEEAKKVTERMKREDEEKKVRVAREKAELRKQVLEANAKQISAKKEAKLAEVEEDRRLAEYQKQEALKKQQREREIEEAKKQRELEMARMRAEQEKVSDTHAELDALRARRAFEAGQRDHRRKEMEKAAKAKQAQRELIAARVEQKKAAEMSKALEIKRQKEEFERNQRVQAEWLEKEKAAAAELHAKNIAHRDGLTRDIVEREKLRKAEREEYLARGAVEAADGEARLRRIRDIRDRKTRELLESGVDKIYTVQLSNFDPEDIISKDYKLGDRVPKLGSGK